jgi:hypothetical protein
MLSRESSNPLVPTRDITGNPGSISVHMPPLATRLLGEAEYEAEHAYDLDLRHSLLHLALAGFEKDPIFFATVFARSTAERSLLLCSVLKVDTAPGAPRDKTPFPALVVAERAGSMSVGARYALELGQRF